jgi:hypothetical protein
MHVPTNEELVKALGLDYEPDKGEYIEIEELNLNEIVTIQESTEPPAKVRLGFD